MPTRLATLNWACRNSHEVCARLLVKRGANINCADPEGKTPLHWACQKRYEACFWLTMPKVELPVCSLVREVVTPSGGQAGTWP